MSVSRKFMVILTIWVIIFFIPAIPGSVLAKNPGIKLVFSHQRGFYDKNFDLTLTTAPAGLTIKYSKDGTDPMTSVTASSGTAPLTIHIDPANTSGRDRAPGFCVRAVAMQYDTAVTGVETHSFIFVRRVVELSPDGQRPGPGWLPQTTSGDNQHINYGMDLQVVNNSLYRNSIVDALMALPSFAMVLDLKDLFDPVRGIYVNAMNHGIEWERPCSIELLHPDGSEGFQVNAGVRIRGGYSRNPWNPKRAFRWFFRQEYGQGKLRYPLFGDEGVDEFDNIDLRTSMNYSWSYDGSDLNTMNRDVFSRDAQRDLGQPYTRSRYYHLYINGTYWGLFQTQERSEASYAASYFGGNRDDYDVVKVATDAGYTIEATDGTLDAWRRLWQAAMNGFHTDEAYFKVQGKNPDGSRNPDYEVLLDIDNLIDYMLCTFVTGDYDGPISNFLGNTKPNNFYAVYNRNGQDGFKFFRHDAEHTMRDHEWGFDRTGPFPAGSRFEDSNPQWLHQQLVEHPHYRTRLMDHVYQHFFNWGALTPAANIARFLARKQEIDLAIIAESARWGDSKHEPAFTKHNAWLPAIDWIMNNFFPERTAIVLNQLTAKGWYPQTPPPAFNSTGGRVTRGFKLSMQTPAGAIYYTTDGSDPFQPVTGAETTTTLIAENATRRVLVPTGDIGISWKRNYYFDDSAWLQGTGGVGYEKGTGYENYIGLNVESVLAEKQTTCYIRIPFTVDDSELANYNFLYLKMLYDDGFVVFLNGVNIAEALAPATLTWSAAATDNHEAEMWETFVLNQQINRLKPGNNLLAIQGLNVSRTSSDFLISSQLLAGHSSNTGTISENAVEYTTPITIDKSTHIKARVVNGDDWSAMTGVALWVFEGLDNLKITEIHYHPLDHGDSTNNDQDYEFIEFKNTGPDLLDLSGLYFSKGIGYTFPAGSGVAPGQFIVLASNTVAFMNRYDFSPFGEYEGQLNNGGETIALNTATGDTLIKLAYQDRFPWPRSADGAGYSLVPREINPYRNQNEPTEWLASSMIHGSPGLDDMVASVTTGSELPRDLTLYQNYPNPFNTGTTFRFFLAQTSQVTLDLFNVLGQRLATIVRGRFPAGDHEMHWQAEGLAAGIYFYRIQVNDAIKARKLLLLK